MRQYPLVCYFLLTFGLTWVYELTVFGVLHLHAIWLWGMLMTLVGPTLAVFLMTAITQGHAGILQLLRRYVLWRVGIPFLHLHPVLVSSLQSQKETLRHEQR